MAENENITEVEETEVTTPETEEVEEKKSADDELAAENARLKAELAKSKLAIDKATKEAAESKRQLKSKMSADEAKAEEEQERQAAIEKELNELRRERAVANMSKKVFAFIQDEKVAEEVAGHLYGAEDVESALGAIQKAWTAREKALKLEYGRIPAPGTGATDGPTVTKAQLDAMTYTERAAFATEHPDEYEKLMGR